MEQGTSQGRTHAVLDQQAPNRLGKCTATQSPPSRLTLRFILCTCVLDISSRAHTCLRWPNDWAPSAIQGRLWPCFLCLTATIDHIHAIERQGAGNNCPSNAAFAACCLLPIPYLCRMHQRLQTWQASASRQCRAFTQFPPCAPSRPAQRRSSNTSVQAPGVAATAADPRADESVRTTGQALPGHGRLYMPAGYGPACG